MPLARDFRTLRRHLFALGLVSMQANFNNLAFVPESRIRGRWMHHCRRLIACAILMSLLGSLGCHSFSHHRKNRNLSSESEIANPVVVPMHDRWLVMDQISDELDNYFDIYREERIRVLDGVMSEGWIETHSKIGATIFEPWRRDSTRGFERMHSTLQTVRRFAKVRVIPSDNSYLVDVKVYKELEDLESPVGATVRGRGLRHDNTLDADRSEPWVQDRTEGWIPMGRDFSLEQLILRNIQSRLAPGLAGAGPPSAYP